MKSKIEDVRIEREYHQVKMRDSHEQRLKGKRRIFIALVKVI